MKKILFVQHGDFRNAFENLGRGGLETYRDQKRSVDFVASLAPAAQSTTLVLGESEYRAELAQNLKSIGIRRSTLSSQKIRGLLDDLDPSHVVLRTPHPVFLREAARRDFWLLPSFADIFQRKGVFTPIRSFNIRRLLLRPRVPCIANHSLNASSSMISVLGLPPEKIVPWDWSRVPLAGAAKAGVADPVRPTAFYAGAMKEEKGVGDCLNAVAELARKGSNFSMTFAGGGDLAVWKRRAEELDISNRVRFLGEISNAQVRTEMRRHDFVIVPSRHSYPEGLPNTIYEGLASRSVLIVSDHPAFSGRLLPDRECLIFKAGDPTALARQIERAVKDGDCYKTISENSESAQDKLYIGLEWRALIEAFIEDPGNKTGWVETNSLATLTSG